MTRTPAEILPTLRDWHELQRELDLRYDDAAKLLGVHALYASPLWEAVFAVAKAHTAAVAQQVGDTDEWLEYWQFECAWGAKPGAVILDDGRDILIDSIEALAVVIVA